MSNSPYYMTKQRASSLFNHYVKEEDWVKALVIISLDLQAEFFSIEQRARLTKAYSSGVIAEVGKDLDTLFSFIQIPEEHKNSLKSKKNPKIKELMVKTRKAAKAIFPNQYLHNNLLRDENMDVLIRGVRDTICALSAIGTTMQSCPSWSNGYELSNIPVPDYLIAPMIEEFNTENKKHIETVAEYNFSNTTKHSQALFYCINDFTTQNAQVIKYYPIDIIPAWEAIKQCLSTVDMTVDIAPKLVFSNINPLFKLMLVDCDSFYDYVFSGMNFLKNINANHGVITEFVNWTMGHFIWVNGLPSDKIETVYNKIQERISTPYEKNFFRLFFRNAYRNALEYMGYHKKESYACLRFLNSILNEDDFDSVDRQINKAFGDARLWNKHEDLQLLRELHPNWKE